MRPDQRQTHNPRFEMTIKLKVEIFFGNFAQLVADLLLKWRSNLKTQKMFDINFRDNFTNTVHWFR